MRSHCFVPCCSTSARRSRSSCDVNLFLWRRWSGAASVGAALLSPASIVNSELWRGNCVDVVNCKICEVRVIVRRRFPCKDGGGHELQLSLALQ